MDLTAKNIVYYLIENMPKEKQSAGFVNEYFRIIKKELRKDLDYDFFNDENIIKTMTKSNFGTMKLNLSLKKPLNEKCSYLDERINKLNTFTFNQLRNM